MDPNYFSDLITLEGGCNSRGEPIHILAADFIIGCRLNGSGEIVVRVPKGFETDYASTPWYLWWWLPRDGKYARAAVGHDYLYAMGSRLGVSRFLADALFREWMEKLDVPRLRRMLIYYAVRLFGGRYYQQ
jgi:hypothetical protein